MLKKLFFLITGVTIYNGALFAQGENQPQSSGDTSLLIVIMAVASVVILLIAVVLFLKSKKASGAVDAELKKIADENKQKIAEIEAKNEEFVLKNEELVSKNQELHQMILRKTQENDIVNSEALQKQQDAEARLKDAEQIHSTFFTYTIHEMRTPLSLVLGTLSHITQNKDLSSDISTELLSAYRNALALQDLADQLIDTRHAGVESKFLRIARYDFMDITRQICDLFVDWIAMNKVDFKLTTQNEHLWMWIDRRKMEYCLRMLVSNSLRNTYLYGKISLDISVVRVGTKAFCSVSIYDDGLNEMENTRRGLKQIGDMANDLGGSFEQNDMGDQGGMKYTLLIPLGKQHLMERTLEFIEPEGDLIKLNDRQKEEIAELIQVAPKKRQTGKKLLIIDDSDQIRWFLKHVFSSEYQILEGRNGQEGIDVALAEQPDIILCDVMMPVKDGLVACKEIKSNPKTCQTPVIMLTAKVDSEDVILGIENGADDYITKPFDIEVLRSKVNSLLKRREQLKQFFTRNLMAVNPEPVSSEDGENNDNVFMTTVIKTIEANLNDPKFEAKVLADSLNVSLPTLYRKIKMYSDCSILELTRTVRLKKAAELILQNRFSIQEVSEMVGFNDTATFRKRFTEQYGVTPSFYGQKSKKES